MKKENNNAIITKDCIDLMINRLPQLMCYDDSYEAAKFISYLAQEYDIELPDDFIEKYNL